MGLVSSDHLPFGSEVDGHAIDIVLGEEVGPQVEVVLLRHGDGVVAEQFREFLDGETQTIREVS
jgi:hypothetical protein